jgi:hypothetical protein
VKKPRSALDSSLCGKKAQYLSKVDNLLLAASMPNINTSDIMDQDTKDFDCCAPPRFHTDKNKWHHQDV